MTKPILMIIAPTGYQDIEYNTPKQLFEQAGCTVITASEQVGECQGKLGGTTQATIALADVAVIDYSAVVFIGGPGAPVYQHNADAHRIAQATVHHNQLLAAICIAPTILAYAGVLKGKQVTVWNKDGKQSTLLEQHGAHYQAQPVVLDGTLITADGPDSATAFAQAILAAMV